MKLNIDGKAIEVQQIGKGSFSTAYQKGQKVYLVSKDYAKEVLAMVSDHSKSQHIPFTARAGYARTRAGEWPVFIQPVVKAPLRAGDSATAWKQAKALRACLDKAWAIARRRKNFNRVYDGYLVADYTVQCAREHKDIPASLVRALELLQSEMANYGSEWTFEFPNRNLATKGGKLVLLDVMFSLHDVEKQRAAAAKKRATSRYRW